MHCPRTHRAAAIRLGIMLAALAIPVGAVPTARAQAHQHSYQTWTSLTVQGHVSPDFQLYLDVNFRFYDDFHPFQMLFRPGFGLRVGEHMWAYVAYAWTPSWTAQHEFVDEHRIWEQWTWDPSGLPDGMRVFVRTRLEQRFRPEVGPDVALRLRQFLRLLVPFGRGSPIHLSLWDEAFIGLTDAGDAMGRLWQRLGFDQNRLVAGLGWNAADGVRIEAGYMNHWVVRHTGTDEIHHVLAINGFWTFR
jgi:hypothetical protein